MQTAFFHLTKRVVSFQRVTGTPLNTSAVRGDEPVQVVLVDGPTSTSVLLAPGVEVGIIIRDPANLKNAPLAGPSPLARTGTAEGGYVGSTNTDTTGTRAAMHVEETDPQKELPSYGAQAVFYYVPTPGAQAIESLPFTWTIQPNFVRPLQPPADVVDEYPEPQQVRTVLAQAATAFQNYPVQAAAAGDALIAGKTPSFTNLAGTGTQNFFSVYNPTANPPVFARNPACIYPWPSAVSVWNSANADGTGGNRGCVTIIARQGALAQAETNHHFVQIYQVGVRHYFLDDHGQPTYADVVAGGGQVAGDGQPGGDIQVVSLQFPMAPAITAARLFAPGAAAKAFPAGTPLLSTNQLKQAVITEVDGHNAADFSVGLRTATAANRVAWSVVGYNASGPGNLGDSDGPSFALTTAGPGLLTSYYTPNAGYSLGEFALQINALLPAGQTVGVVPLNVLGAASQREVTGPTNGPLLAVDPVTGKIAPENIPALPSNLSNVEQVWDGTADVTLGLTTTVFRGTYSTLTTNRAINIVSGSQDGRRITLLLPRFSGGGSLGIGYTISGNNAGVAAPYQGFVSSTSISTPLFHYVLEYSGGGWVINDPSDGYDFVGVSGSRSATGLTYAASVALDFRSAYLQTLTLGGDVSFTAMNIRIGRTILLRVVGDSVDRNVTFPAWRNMNAAPTIIPAGKAVEVQLTCWGNNLVGNISARYTVQP